MQTMNANAIQPETVYHRVGFKMWKAVQNGRGVLVRNLINGYTTYLEAPTEWGEAWSWWHDSDGIWFKRERR